MPVPEWKTPSNSFNLSTIPVKQVLLLNRVEIQIQAVRFPSLGSQLPQPSHYSIIRTDYPPPSKRLSKLITS